MGPPAVAPDRITALGNGFKTAQAFLSALELGVFTALSEGPLGLSALRATIGIHQRGARDFLDLLVALGMLDRDAEGRYQNIPETSIYLDRNKPTYIGDYFEFAAASEFPAWTALTEALRTGRPQRKSATREASAAAACEPGQSAPHYGVAYARPGGAERMAKAMTAATLAVAHAIAAKFPWQDYATMLDVGTAEGCLPVQVLQRHPHLTGAGFDLPPMAPLFDAYVERHALSSRLRFHPGSFFTDPLPGSEVLVMGRVLHNWDLATRQMLLAKAHQALPPGGALIIYERLIDDARRSNTPGLISSLNMLVMTDGGVDFTGADCARWMQEAGFQRIRTEPLVDGHSMLVGFK
jgi:hypothetical protein